MAVAESTDAAAFVVEFSITELSEEESLEAEDVLAASASDYESGDLFHKYLVPQFLSWAARLNSDTVLEVADVTCEVAVESSVVEADESSTTEAAVETTAG